MYKGEKATTDRRPPCRDESSRDTPFDGLFSSLFLELVVIPDISKVVEKVQSHPILPFPASSSSSLLDTTNLDGILLFAVEDVVVVCC